MLLQTPTPHTRYEFWYALIVFVLTFVAVEFRHYYKNRGERRRKRAQEIKEEAEAGQIHITSSKDAGDEIVSAARLLAKAEREIGALQIKIDRLESQRMEWERTKKQMAVVQARNELMTLQIEEYQDEKKRAT